jgi:hypothetical protein
VSCETPVQIRTAAAPTTSAAVLDISPETTAQLDDVSIASAVPPTTAVVLDSSPETAITICHD